MLTGATLLGGVLALTGGGRLRRATGLDDHLDLPAGTALSTIQRRTT